METEKSRNPRPIYLFTEEEFDKAKQKDVLPSKCNFCNNVFYRTKKHIYRRRYESVTGGSFCSIKCANKYHRIGQLVLCNCSQCNKEFNRGLAEFNRSKNHFCSSSCAAIFNNKIREYDPKTEPLKTVNCNLCYVIINVKSRTSTKNYICEDCRIRQAAISNKTRVRINNISHSICKCCGEYDCINKICKWFKNGGEKTSSKLGITFTKKGTPEIFNEIAKVKDYYVDLYHNKQMSLPEIQKNTGVFLRSIQTVFNLFQIESRNLSESVSLSRILHPEYKTPKIIKHLTWDDKEVILRSNNELEIAKDLDSKKIEYKVESFKIPYINKDGDSANYIPDFYIPSENLIIEAKGSYYRDEENDRKKAVAARSMGYKYKYILDYIETEI